MPPGMSLSDDAARSEERRYALRCCGPENPLPMSAAPEITCRAPSLGALGSARNVRLVREVEHRRVDREDAEAHFHLLHGVLHGEG